MRNGRYIAGLIFTVALTGCAPDDLNVWKRPDRGSADFAKLLNRGKSPASSFGVPGSYSLTGPSGPVTQVTTNLATGLPHLVAYDTSKMPDVAVADLREHALKFIAANAAFFGVNSDELRDASKTPRTEDFRGNIVFQFTRYYQGILVDGSDVQVVFAPFGGGQYRVREFINNSYGPIEITVEQRRAPDDNSLIDRTGLDGVIEKTSYPVIYVVESPQGLYEYHYATRLVLEDPVSHENFTVTVNAEGQILEAYSNHYHVALRASLPERSYVFNKNAEFPIYFGSIGSATADKDGNVNASGSSVTVNLSTKTGSRSYIGTTGSAPKTFTLNVSGDKALFNDSKDTNLAVVNAFVKINVIADFVAQHLTSSQAALLKTAIKTNVNVSGNCNAYYNGSSVNFFPAGGQCANTGTIDDVMYHEWGHALDDDMNGINGGDLSEGIGDILAFLKTGDHVLGPGFYAGQTKGLRNALNTKKWPADKKNEVHADGEIISAAFWDMRVAMIKRYGEQQGAFMTEKMFFNSLLTIKQMTQAYDAIVRLDDDDNNTTTRSPNFCLINEAFANHGFATKESNCVDVVTPGDDSLFLAIRSYSAPGTVTLWASSDAQSKSVALCMGQRAACVKDKKIDINFAPARATPDGIQIYKSDSPIQIQEGGMATILSLDASGNIRAARSVKFSAAKPSAGSTP